MINVSEIREHMEVVGSDGGHVGTVERILGCQVFPDSASMDLGENPQWLYNVVFDGTELWGSDADPTVKVSIDAFEPYLELV